MGRKKTVWLFLIALYSLIRDGDTGSRSTFEFPSRVNLSGPSLYCIARTSGKYRRHSIGLAGSTRLTRSDFRLNLLLLIGQLGAWGVIIKNIWYFNPIHFSSRWKLRDKLKYKKTFKHDNHVLIVVDIGLFDISIFL